MTLRILFTGEGTSDAGLKPHIEAVAAQSGRSVTVAAPELGRLGVGSCHSIPEKLHVLKELGDVYDIVIVHRDADRGTPAERENEIAEAVAAQWPGRPHVAVVPVRMLEAWLLLDESAIRHVSENPNGRVRLGLPRGKAVETVADPKKLLKDTLARSSGYRGRRLVNFQKRFPQHRHKLLERLDPCGPVAALPSWQAFTHDLRNALSRV
ncbi:MULTISPECIES: DUF4276 family protein [unclassified Streptomyces]|uniref:DUF4276 family protein n=1 Tax=unclassified Streptomyces TaxID=2593676 RepID=UPI0022B6160C|nr:MULTISPECIES: DUF4276 family protein [unclassified Streptomyces]MCZ7414916.1 DUF4276 family protein [Streptomyces sp. WMMC897]MCZ7431859.1 DUF4276 family protein [Streptomyces sp. WMMC1477]